jgi:vancomycin resistance protein YoaR
MIFKKHAQIKLAILLMLPFLVIAVFIGIFEFKYSNKYYPGITIAGELVGGKTYDEVSEEFTTRAESLTKDGLTLVFEKNDGDSKLNIPATSTGFTPDILVEYFSINDLQQTVAQAYSLGRQGNIIQKIKEQLSLFYGRNFDLPVSIHKEAIQSLLSRETKYFLDPGTPAQFSIDKNDEVVISPEKLSDNIDIENIVSTIVQKLSAMETTPIVFEIQRGVPYPTQKQLEPFLSLAEAFYKSVNMSFYYKNDNWKVDNEELISWLTLETNNKMAVDSKKLKMFFSASVVPHIDNPPINSRFEMRNNNLIEISPGKSGKGVNVAEAQKQINEIISYIQQSFATESFVNILSALSSNSKINFYPKNKTVNIPIETIETEPEITQVTIDKYKIRDLIGRATTNFTGGSLDRQHNIEVGASKLTGILIAPNEEFSTVQGIGFITEEAGFVKEYVIKGNQTVKELGGGLCQIATTLFRTALSAGLPITERANHQYVIPYYGPGLDATIYGPHPDFRFLNDTGNYLLLQGKAINNEVTFELYGINDGRIAEVSTPVLSNEKPVPATRNIVTPSLPAGTVQCQTATHKGITADATYIVSYPNGTKKETIFHSVYKPWPQVCLIGSY